MEPRLRTALDLIAKSTQVVSETAFVHDSSLLATVPRPYESRSGDSGRMRDELASFLYQAYYNNSFAAQRAVLNDVDVGPLKDPIFAKSLADANSGNGYYQEGWHVDEFNDPDGLIVSNNLIKLWIKRTMHLRPVDQSAGVGDFVAIKFPKDADLSPVFYSALGDAFQRINDKDMVRMYFNISPRGAVPLVNILTNELNLIMISFHLKILANPKWYDRYDCAILYFDKSNYTAVRDIVANFPRQLSKWFRRDAPLFTKPLFTGISVAEEPINLDHSNQSFGSHRCQILADGLINAFCGRQPDSESRFLHMTMSLQQHGIDIARPYLNKGSKDQYH